MNRRTFLRNSAGIFIPACLGIVPAKAQTYRFGSQLNLKAAAAGGGNNAALVGSQFTGTGDGTQPSSRALAMPGNVTSGNVVLFGGSVFHGATLTITVGMLTKTAGTATIGTIVLDSFTSATTTRAGVAIYRVPITGTGSLTLTWNYATAAFSGVGVAEFTGLNATPLDSGGTGQNNGGGASTAETTGTITTVGNGLICSIIAEGNSSLNWTRTNSATVIKQDSSATSDFTFVFQFLINNSTSNALTSTSDANATVWNDAHASYKTS